MWPIAHIESPFKEKFGVPRQPGLAKEIPGRIVFQSPYCDPEAFSGLEKFSHIWIIFKFHQANSDKWSPKVRPPRLGGNEKLGVFATRSPFRPNSLGLSLVQLEEVKIENSKTSLLIRGHDLVDGTPVFDIKPYLPEVESITSAGNGWTEFQNKNEQLTVVISREARDKIDNTLLNELISFLQLNPRPSFHQDNRIYKNRYDRYDIVWKVEDERVHLIDVEILS